MYLICVCHTDTRTRAAQLILHIVCAHAQDSTAVWLAKHSTGSCQYEIFVQEKNIRMYIYMAPCVLCVGLFTRLARTARLPEPKQTTFTSLSKRENMHGLA